MSLQAAIKSRVPMVVILGATETGKTKLGIEWAQKYGGEIINYFVLNKIGEGSFADVVKCQSINSHEYYAAKILRKRFKSAVDAESCAEVTASMQLRDHPNILRLIEFMFDPAPRKLTLIFELMDMSMYDLIRKRTRPVPEARARRQLMQILNALSYMHRNGLFHRDVKPENILLRNTDGANGHGEEGEVVKLADLGSAKASHDRRPHTEYISTRWYRSPECLLTAGYYGPKMDVWSTGCVYYELLTLRPLFPGDSELDQLHRIHAVLGAPRRHLLDRFAKHKSRNLSFSFAECAASGLRALLPAASDDVCRLLRMMLVYDPAFRLNVKRLLEDSSFKSLRESEGFPRVAAKSTEGIIKSEPNSSRVTYRFKIADVHVHKAKSLCDKNSPPSKKNVYLSESSVTDRPVLRRLKPLRGKFHEDGVSSNRSLNLNLKNKSNKRTRQIAGMNIVSPKSSTDNPAPKKKSLMDEIKSTSKDTIGMKEKFKLHKSFISSDTLQHSRSANFIEKIKPKCKNVCLPSMHDIRRNSKSTFKKTVLNEYVGSSHKKIILPSIDENFVQELGHATKKNF